MGRASIYILNNALSFSIIWFIQIQFQECQEIQKCFICKDELGAPYMQHITKCVNIRVQVQGAFPEFRNCTDFIHDIRPARNGSHCSTAMRQKQIITDHSDQSQELIPLFRL